MVAAVRAAAAATEVGTAMTLFVRKVSTFALMALPVLAGVACKSTPQPASQDPSAQPSAPPAPSSADGSKPPAGANGVACGPTTCKPGESCCNESCGICTPEGGFCTQQACLGDAGAADAASPKTSGQSGQSGQCKVDADCRTRSVYCKETPCACLALSKVDPNPTCASGSVQCFVDPCLKKVAQCVSGHCVTASTN